MEVKPRINAKKELDATMCAVPVMLTKEFDFEAGHHLTPYEGRCEYSHGHSYHMEVTVKGIPDRTTGLVIDFKKLKTAVEGVIDELDHNYLNEYFRFNTTCENMIRWMWVEINSKLPIMVDLECIKLWETRTSYATLTRDMVEKAKVGR